MFDRTILENIQYGDNSRPVSMEEVIDAARRANIHNFVASLPAGYDTRFVLNVDSMDWTMTCSCDRDRQKDKHIDNIHYLINL